jgi:hypothetical protein
MLWRVSRPLRSRFSSRPGAWHRCACNEGDAKTNHRAISQVNAGSVANAIVEKSAICAMSSKPPGFILPCQPALADRPPSLMLWAFRSWLEKGTDFNPRCLSAGCWISFVDHESLGTEKPKYAGKKRGR